MFFEYKGVVHHEFVSAARTVNVPLYVQVSKRLREAILRKCSTEWQGGWSLHHDNALFHTSIVVQTWLAKNNILLFYQPPYSLDLAPLGFWLFPRIKMSLKSNCFDTIEDIKNNMISKLGKISKQDFHYCFQQCQEQWSKCVRSDRAYFEGN